MRPRPARGGDRDGAALRRASSTRGRTRCGRSRPSSVPFLVAGAYAFFEYTGIFRDTKDLDSSCGGATSRRPSDALDEAGFRTELVDPVWLGKGCRGEWFVDLIFSLGERRAVVDDLWFEHARPGEVMGVPVLLAPPEEMIWSKAFVLRARALRRRTTSNHLSARCGERMDWDRLLARFDRYWEVLLSHLLLFRFAFPCERRPVPDRVMRELLARGAGQSGGRLRRGASAAAPLISRCSTGTIWSTSGYEDGRAWDERGADGEGGARWRTSFRLAAVADLTAGEDQHGRFRELVSAVNGEAEGLVLAGDLTDHGRSRRRRRSPRRSRSCACPARRCSATTTSRAATVKDIVRILHEAKVQVLDGDHAIFDKRLGIAGVKGFARRVRAGRRSRPSASPRSRPSCRRR